MCLFVALRALLGRVLVGVVGCCLSAAAGKKDRDSNESYKVDGSAHNRSLFRAGLVFLREA